MARPRQQQKKAPSKGRGADIDEELLRSDNEQEDDAFGSGKDQVKLRVMSDDDDDDEPQEHAVFDLSDEEDEDEDEDEDDAEDEDDEDALEAAMERGGKMAQLAKQAKALGQKLKLQQREDEDEEEDEEEAGGKKGKKAAADLKDKLWGANKRAYYDGDDAEATDDDEAVKEEEEEVLRLQREREAGRAAADFGLSDEDEDDESDEDESGDEEDEDEEDEEGEATMGALAKGKSSKQQQQKQQQQDGKKAKGAKAQQAAAAAVAGGMEVEEVARDVGALSGEAAQAALLADAPELLALLADLKESLVEVRHRVGPVLQEVRDGRLATSEGLSYLESKYLLLLQYCTHIVFYVLMKAEGRPVRDHPCITRLVELRSYLEKARPIDKALAYQLDKLVRAAEMAAGMANAASAETAQADADASAPAAGGAEDDRDVLRFRPRPDQLVAGGRDGGAAGAPGASGFGGEEAGGDGVYRPPKINPVAMEGADDIDKRELNRNERRRLKEVRAKASRSALVRELAEELAGAPREEKASVLGFDSLAAIKQRQRLEARAGVEEELFQRVRLSRDEAAKLKAQRREGLSGRAVLDDFADEVADIVDMGRGADGGASTLNDLFARNKVGQKFGGEAPQAKARGGDEDLPLRQPLHERRAKFDAVAAKRSAAGAFGADDDDDRPAAREREEDDFYKQAKAAASGRKKVREDKHSAPGMLPPLPDETMEGARAINYAIEKNRGLTPHRRKDLKNPRKKHRLAYAKALVRRSGQVQGVRSGEAGAYGGEATGIKSKVVKSRKMG